MTNPNAVEFDTYASAKSYLYEYGYEFRIRHGDMERWENESHTAMVQAMNLDTLFADSEQPVDVRFFTKN